MCRIFLTNFALFRAPVVPRGTSRNHVRVRIPCYHVSHIHNKSVARMLPVFGLVSYGSHTNLTFGGLGSGLPHTPRLTRHSPDPSPHTSPPPSACLRLRPRLRSLAPRALAPAPPRPSLRLHLAPPRSGLRLRPASALAPRPPRSVTPSLRRPAAPLRSSSASVMHLHTRTDGTGQHVSAA